MEDKKKRKLIDAIYKKALGYSVAESVEELSATDGELNLVKKKITTKEVPPDAACAKLIMDSFSTDIYANMSEEELLKEKQRLMNELKNAEQFKGG